MYKNVEGIEAKPTRSKYSSAWVAHLRHGCRGTCTRTGLRESQRRVCQFTRLSHWPGKKNADLDTFVNVFAQAGGEHLARLVIANDKTKIQKMDLSVNNIGNEGLIALRFPLGFVCGSSSNVFNQASE